MKYVVSMRALETMERECRKSPETETGGILVGFRDQGQVTITHATGPGLNWERSAQHFVKDTDYLQSVLNLLAEYYQVNYLGVWHKHPQSLPHPSLGDVASAMDEISDSKVGLDELITPICIMESGRVMVLPYVIRDGDFASVGWEPVPHESISGEPSLSDQWYTKPAGQRRLAEELQQFEEIGVSVEVRKGDDETYRFHAPLGDDSPLRLVMLCPGEYPVVPPEVAVYDETSQKFEPVSSEILDNWSIFQYLGDLYKEYQRNPSSTAAGAERS